jgi:hypothetical protein
MTTEKFLSFFLRVLGQPPYINQSGFKQFVGLWIIFVDRGEDVHIVSSQAFQP